jgi:hypothetical protein
MPLPTHEDAVAETRILEVHPDKILTVVVETETGIARGSIILNPQDVGILGPALEAQGFHLL